MANDLIIIDETSYAVNIVSIVETSRFVDKYLNQTEDWDIKRELAGIFFDYEITLGEIQDQAVMLALYAKIHEFTEFHTVSLPHNNGTQTFQAYITGTSRSLKKKTAGDNRWSGFIIKFIAKAPQITG
ncbi:hypothetical protein AAFA46_08070 [Oscillospiraceae bacterium WX1]